jgi:hypothetical protein
MTLWYIFPRFGMFYIEKSGSPALVRTLWLENRKYPPPSKNRLHSNCQNQQKKSAKKIKFLCGAIEPRGRCYDQNFAYFSFALSQKR